MAIYGLFIFLIDWVPFGEGGVTLKLDTQAQEGGRISGREGQGGWGFLEDWTISMDVCHMCIIL